MYIHTKIIAPQQNVNKPIENMFQRYLCLHVSAIGELIMYIHIIALAAWSSSIVSARGATDREIEYRQGAGW
jgi:hypothetical protein